MFIIHFPMNRKKDILERNYRWSFGSILCSDLNFKQLQTEIQIRFFGSNIVFKQWNYKQCVFIMGFTFLDNKT